MQQFFYTIGKNKEPTALIHIINIESQNELKKNKNTSKTTYKGKNNKISQATITTDAINVNDTEHDFKLGNSSFVCCCCSVQKRCEIEGYGKTAYIRNIYRLSFGKE